MSTSRGTITRGYGIFAAEKGKYARARRDLLSPGDDRPRYYVTIIVFDTRGVPRRVSWRPLSRPDGNTFYGSARVTSGRIEGRWPSVQIEAPITKTLDLSYRSDNWQDLLL